MSVVRHKDFPLEEERLNQSVVRVAKETAIVRDIERSQFAEVTHYRETSGGSYNTDWFVAEKLYVITCQKLKDLEHAADNPYFARVDFRRDGLEEIERCYIGKWGVTDAQTRKPYIYDWRSPLANLYYGGQVGPAEYMAPGGVMTGEISLKRIFQIAGGRLNSIVDADVVTQDQYLHDVLSDHADARLRDIVTTIQQEQNDIIRHNYQRAMVVQGVAGAGKTTVALHRITWLLYTYQQTMAPENLMVIAPSPLFLNYISAVLPELGAENVLQTTFLGLGELLTGKKFPKLDDSGTLLALLELPQEQRDALTRAARLKGSLLFKECVNRFARALAEGLAPGDFTLGPAVILSRAEVTRLLTADLSPFPVARRLPQLKRMLAARLKEALERLRAELEADAAKRANYLREREPEDSPARRERMAALYAARNAKLAELEAQAATAVDAYMKRFPKIELMEQYRALLQPQPGFELPAAVDRGDWERLCADSVARLDSKRIETADIAPLTHLCALLLGHTGRLDIHHTVLDEAQDFSPFQFDLLKGLTQNASFTIVGDLAQGIHGYRGVTDWRGFLDDVFGPGNADYQELVTSYRNTVEIMTFAGRVAAHHPFPGQRGAQPVLRHGREPEVLALPDTRPEDTIAEKLKELLAAGMKTVAVVHKRPADCEALYKKLKGKLDAPLSLYRDGDSEYRGGAMVLPAHMVKGLEFDAIIVADCSEAVFPDDPLHCRLLYVCLTRPLHRLVCYYRGEPSPLLRGAMEEESL